MSESPQDLERTDEQPKSQYLTRRDVRVFSISIVCLAVLLSPVYFVLKEGADAYRCKKNLDSIYKSITLYANDNDGRLPPLYVTADDQGTPLIENNAVYTWANLVDPYMKRETSFKCPKSHEHENYIDHHAETGKPMEVSYGMYAPYAGMAISDIDNADQVALIGETSNRGANKTFDPFPILNGDGSPAPYDGFSIAWSNGNVAPDDKTTFVSRLAYANTANGDFRKDGVSRHPEGNHFMTASGRVLSLKPNAARIEWDAKRKKALGLWATPEHFLMDKQR